jgi:hypothetical protein
MGRKGIRLERWKRDLRCLISIMSTRGKVTPGLEMGRWSDGGSKLV